MPPKEENKAEVSPVQVIRSGMFGQIEQYVFGEDWDDYRNETPDAMKVPLMLTVSSSASNPRSQSAADQTLEKPKFDDVEKFMLLYNIIAQNKNQFNDVLKHLSQRGSQFNA